MPDNRFRLRQGLCRRLITVTMTVLAAMAALLSPAKASAAAAGTPVRSAPLSAAVWSIPGSNPSASRRIVYWTRGSQGQLGLSSGAIFLPTSPPPSGGYPVISWAHGTVGIGNQCAPSRRGPIYAERDNSYLAHWLRRGYAIVASDYYGLGTQGIEGTGHHPYGDAQVAGYNVVDMVRAARTLMPAVLSTRWAAVGQSQGAQASVAAASVAADYAPELDFIGSVSTGLTGYFDRLAPLILAVASHASVPIPIEDATAYVVFTLAGVRAAHPELDVDRYLSPLGKRLITQAEQACDDQMNAELADVAIASLFAHSPDDPRLERAFAAMQRIPTAGFTRPLFIGEGYLDGTAIYPVTAALVNDMRRSGATVEFRGYPTGHSDTMAASLPDSTPFLQR